MKDNKKVLLILPILLILVVAGIWASINGQPWLADKDGHYRATLFGIKVPYEAHTVDSSRCTVCDAWVAVNADGSASVSKNNESGDQLYYISYDPQGNVKEHRAGEYSYDSEGNMQSNKEYENGKLVVERVIFRDADGKKTGVNAVFYRNNGSMVRCKYDARGNLIKEVHYDDMGNMGDIFTHVRQYDDYFNSVKNCKTYLNGRLITECEYGTPSCVHFNLERKIEYDEDGSRTVYEYEEGKLKKTTAYDAAGNIIN